MTTAARRLLLVHAHPDDESITTGGTIARYAAEGAQVTLVTCTLGEEGEIIPPGLALLGAHAADQLGGYRIGELRAACAALGVTDHRFLGGAGRWRDSGMAGTAANRHPRALVGCGAGTQSDALAVILAEVRPQVVVTYDSHGGYGHPDHIRAHEITMAAVSGNREVVRVFHAVNSRRATREGLRELAGLDGLPFAVPEAGDLQAVDDARIDTVVDISAYRDAKLAALRSHATQVSVWRGPEGAASFALSDGLAQPLPTAEYFVLAHGTRDGTNRDLFGGLGLGSGHGGYS